MAISKGRRFEIFKRDGFTCQYCGQRPPEVVLEVDHIHPQSKGGSDEDMNLITACFACNNGKRAKVLSERAPKPDADTEFLAIQQEMAELRRYLAAKDEREAMLSTVINHLQEVFYNSFKLEYAPADAQFRIWLGQYPPENIEYAILIAYRHFMRSSNSWLENHILDISRYISGVLRNMGE